MPARSDKKCKPGCKCGFCGAPKVVRRERFGRRLIKVCNLIKLTPQSPTVCGACLMQGAPV